jgi:Raf kinase inhibitor-like YbhB/YbcL family protein
MKAVISTLLAVLILTTLVFCQSKDDKSGLRESTATADVMEDIMPELKITSMCFMHEGMIPARCTCDGDDLSPEIFWKHVPKEAKTIAMICDDPDAPMGTWVHWVVYNIPATDTGIVHAVKANDSTYTQGTSSWKTIGYGGPCPPSGTHRYFFKVYALDVVLDLKAGATKEKLEKAMEGHIVARGELMGMYKRQS